MTQLVTALPPGAPDDGDAGRQHRGMAIAAGIRIEKNRLGYKVPSQSGNGSYVVNTDDDDPICTCPDFTKRQQPCKHIYAVRVVIQREELPDETVVEQVTTTTTYRQDWPACNAAQEHEQEHFRRLLRQLCDTIPQPSQGKGRPRLKLSDKVFAAALKVYGTKSTRRSMTDIRNAEASGLLDKALSCASTYRSMEDPTITPLLKNLIELSALPMRALEQDFAPDSTGFSSKYYTRWLDTKWGKMKTEAVWTKAHAMTGVRTNVVTAIEVTEGQSADAPFFAPFIKTTASNFTIREISADKAYLSKKNLRAAEAVGGKAYIPFKTNSTPTQKHHKRDALWETAYHEFALNRAESDAHYHKRSNAETTFHMIKAKFGALVRSKIPAARVNEVLLKFLCHNICVVIQTAYELGLKTTLEGPETFGATEPFAPKVGLN